MSLDELEFVGGERLLNGVRNSSRETYSAGAGNPVCCCHYLAGVCTYALRMGACVCRGGRRAAFIDGSSASLCYVPFCSLMYNLVQTFTPPTQQMQGILFNVRQGMFL